MTNPHLYNILDAAALFDRVVLVPTSGPLEAYILWREATELLTGNPAYTEDRELISKTSQDARSLMFVDGGFIHFVPVMSDGVCSAMEYDAVSEAFADCTTLMQSRLFRKPITTDVPITLGPDDYIPPESEVTVQEILRIT